MRGSKLMFSFLITLAVFAFEYVAGRLLQPRVRPQKPDIDAIQPPSIAQGKPIREVIGTQKIAPYLMWWGNRRSIQRTDGTVNYGFDLIAGICMGPVDVLDIVFDVKSAVQNLVGAVTTVISPILGQVTEHGPPLVIMTGDAFPFLASDYPTGAAEVTINANNLFGGVTSQDGISFADFRFHLGGADQVADTTGLGSTLPNYPGVCYTTCVNAYFGPSPVPKPIYFIVRKCPGTLSALVGHPEYALLGTYDANPVEALYHILTSSASPAKLKGLLRIDPAKLDVDSFTAALVTVYNEAQLGSIPGNATQKPTGNVGNGSFSEVSGGVAAPIEVITVTITTAVIGGGDFSVTGSASGSIGPGSVGTPFLSSVINFLLSVGTTDFAVGDSWTFNVTLGAGAGVSFTIGDDFEQAADKIAELLTDMDAVLYPHPETGLGTLKLCRSDYLLADLQLLDEGVYEGDIEYSETDWPDTYNEITVNYVNRGPDSSAQLGTYGNAWPFQAAPVRIPNLAALQAVDGNPQLANPLDLRTIATGPAATIIGQRSLRILSFPRGQGTLVLNRLGHALMPATPFLLSSARYGLVEEPMRISDIQYGKLEKGRILVYFQQDVYATGPVLFPPPSFQTSFNPPPAFAQLDHVTISPEVATVAVENSTQFVGQGWDANDQPYPVTFVYSDNDDTVGTVDPDTGIARGVAVGAVRITAKDPITGKSASAVLTVVAADATPLTFSITPSALSIPVGGKQTFVATARDASGNIVADTWTYSVSNADGTVEASSGAFQALLAGTLNVIATDGTNTVMAAVTVTALVTGGKSVQIATGDYLGATVTGLMSPTHVSLRARFIGGGSAAGNIGVMTVCNPAGTKWAVDVGYNITGTTVTFFGACQNAAPVELFAIDESDLPVPGTALTIAAQYDATTGGAIALEDDYGTVYGTPWTAANGAAGCGSGAVDATVTDVGIGISVASGSAVLAQGFICSGVQLTDAALIAVAGIPAVADPGNLAIWNFDGSDLTEVSAGPSLVLSGGSATYVDDVGPYFWGLGTGSPAPDAIVVSPSEITLDPGDTYTPTFGAFDQYGRPIADTITATSADPTTGTVDGGTPTSGLIVAIKAGTVVVTFTDGTRTGTITVTVNAPGGVPATLSVSPSSAVGIVGGTVKFTATAKDSTGKVVPDPVTWASSDSTNAPVDTTGLAACKTAGSYTITADDGTLTPATAALTVSTRTTGGGGSSAFEVGVHVNAAYLENTTDIANLIALAPATHSRVCRDVCLPHHIATSSTGRNWTYMDAAVDAYVAAGIEPYFTIAFWPEWLSGSSDPSVAPSDFAAAVTWYAGFVGEVVTRYKGRVSRWEFWNEPNEGGEGQWVNPNVNNYVTLNNACRKAAKAADPTCQWIMGGGVTGLTATEAAWIGIPFLKNMIALGCQGDALSIHVYPPGDPLVDNSPTLNSGAPDILRVQQILLAAGLNIPIQVTEFGWSDASSNATYGTYITELLQWMQENQTGLSTVSGGTFTSGFGRIELATLFLLKDTSAFSYGLFNISGSPKTAQFNAFVAFCESIGQ